MLNISKSRGFTWRNYFIKLGDGTGILETPKTPGYVSLHGEKYYKSLGKLFYYFYCTKFC